MSTPRTSNPGVGTHGPLHLEEITDWEAVRDEWSDLAAPTKNIFATWEWNSIWWRHFGSPGRLLATTCRTDDGVLRAILPLYVQRVRPLRVVRFLGHGAGDELGPICRPGDRPVVAQALETVLRDARADLFIGEQLPQEALWGELLGARRLSTEGSPVVRLFTDDWDAFLQSRSRNLRKAFGKQERKLMREHDVDYRLTAGTDRLSGDLDMLFTLHRLRWSSEPTDFSKREAFHREFAACAFDKGWLRLRLLEIDGHPRAVSYGLRFEDVESSYQSGRDPTWDSFSVGFLMRLTAIRKALEDGMTEYRLLRGHEAYKYRLADEDLGLETIGVTRGLAASAALGFARATRATRAGLSKHTQRLRRSV